jgi:DNA-binding YbaB/EbfC family protein
MPDREYTMAKGKSFGGIGGGMGGGNIQQLMRQAQKMQEQVAQAQEELDVKEYEASSGGGMVTCKVSGKRELLSLTIKPEAVDPEDTEMLQDLVVAAVNEALRLGEETREKVMAQLTPGMGGLL